MSKLVLYQQAAAPAVPAAGAIHLFAKTDDRLYWQEDDGDVHKLAHSGEAETFGALTVTSIVGLGGLVGLAAPITFTKPTAGDSVLWTNGGLTPKTGYLYSDDTYIGLFSGAGATGNGVLISATQILERITGAGTIGAWSGTGLGVTGTVTASGGTGASGVFGSLKGLGVNFPTWDGNGQGTAYAGVTTGLVLAGKGSTYDLLLANQGGGTVAYVLTGASKLTSVDQDILSTITLGQAGVTNGRVVTPGGVDLQLEAGLAAAYIYLKTGGVNRLAINNAGATFSVDMTAITGGFNAVRAVGASTFATGKGLELIYNIIANEGTVYAYDRDTSAYKDTVIDGASVLLRYQGTTKLTVNNNGVNTVGINDDSTAHIFLRSNSVNDKRLYVQSSVTGTTDADGMMLGTINSIGYLFNYENSRIEFGTNAITRAQLTDAGLHLQTNKMLEAFGVGNHGNTNTESLQIFQSGGYSYIDSVKTGSGTARPILLAIADVAQMTVSTDAIDAIGLLTITRSAKQAIFQGPDQGSITIKSTSPGYQLFSAVAGKLGFWNDNAGTQTLELASGLMTLSGTLDINGSYWITFGAKNTLYNTGGYFLFQSHSNSADLHIRDADGGIWSAIGPVGIVSGAATMSNALGWQQLHQMIAGNYSAISLRKTSGTVSQWDIGNNDGPLSIYKAGDTVKLQLTVDGFTKMANDGTFLNVGAPYHELRSNQADFLAYISNKHATDPYGLYIFFSAATPDDNTHVALAFNDATERRFVVYSDGDVFNHDGTYGTISDEVYKAEIQPVNSQWEDVKNIELYKYRNVEDIVKHGDAAPWLLGASAQGLERTDNNGLVRKIQNGLRVDGAVDDMTLLKKFAVALQEAMQRIEALETQLGLIPKPYVPPFDRQPKGQSQQTMLH